MSVDRVETRAAGRHHLARSVVILALATAAAVGLLLVLQLTVVRPALEADLGARASAALRDAGYGGVRVNASGRDLTASGTVTGGRSAADVEAALAAVPGVRGVTVTGVQLLTAPITAEEGVVTEVEALDAADLDSGGAVESGSAGAPVGSATDTEEVDVPVEGSRLLTSGFANATQSSALPPLTFVDGAPTLTADSDAALQAAASQVMVDMTGRVFVIRIHTDSLGASAYNQWLSERRAAVVLDELLALGVPAERLTITGVGESEPLIDPELTDADRATNRRVEILPAA